MTWYMWVAVYFFGTFFASLAWHQGPAVGFILCIVIVGVAMVSVSYDPDDTTD